MEKLEADIVIVGSGTSGTTVAKELATRGRKVLIVEKGHFFSQDRIGSELHAYKFYDKHGIWSKSKEGVFYYRTIMVGGTSVVSCANGVRALENEFKNLGIDLTEEFFEVERELGIKPIPNRFIGNGSRKIMEAAGKLGFNMKPMPKFINFEKCISCGNCVLGCCSGAKWTALQYLKEAQDNDASLVTGINITKILISNGKAIGIEGYNQAGRKIEIIANNIVLAAGGIGTPIILQNSGIEAGQKLFLDLFNVTIGLTKGVGLIKEPVMAAVSHSEGFILSPFIDSPLVLASVIPASQRRNLKITTQRKHMLGIMVKIKDDCLGRVHKDGLIEKTITSNDIFGLNKGADIAKEILINAGVDPKTVMTTKIRGAHPGGTAAMGEVVNENFETKIKGLFVCDASILPTSPGLPPIVTIIALSKKFVKNIVGVKEKI
ncbi:MAG: FAD-dependent oxidoreductase [Candidatus Omnitrophota bacterium]